jgi:hypothetical protein
LHSNVVVRARSIKRRKRTHGEFPTRFSLEDRCENKAAKSVADTRRVLNRPNCGVPPRHTGTERSSRATRRHYRSGLSAIALVCGAAMGRLAGDADAFGFLVNPLLQRLVGPDAAIHPAQWSGGDCFRVSVSGTRAGSRSPFSTITYKLSEPVEKEPIATSVLGSPAHFPDTSDVLVRWSPK